MKLLNSLSGYKTYIAAALAALLAFDHVSQILPPDVRAMLLTLTGAGGLAALRAAHSAAVEEIKADAKLEAKP